MHTIAVTNQKGGTAKTTTAVNLAAALGERGVPTLLIDLDPQASASGWLDAAGAHGLLDALTDDAHALEELVHETPAPGVHLIPASTDLAHADRELRAQPGGELALHQLVDELPPGRWQWAILDCPPQIGTLTACGLLAADAVLIPVEMSSMALAGLGALLTTLQRARRGNPDLTIAGILACRVDYRTLISRQIVRQLAAQFPEFKLSTVIRERVRLREAFSHQLPITLYDPAGDAAADYRRLAGELLRRAEETDHVA